MVKQAKLEAVESYGLNIKESELKGALKNEEDNKKAKSGSENKSENKEEIADYQLIRALDLVKALNLYSVPQNEKAVTESK